MGVVIGLAGGSGPFVLTGVAALRRTPDDYFMACEIPSCSRWGRGYFWTDRNGIFRSGHYNPGRRPQS
jgi:hypothetical protein